MAYFHLVEYVAVHGLAWKRYLCTCCVACAVRGASKLAEEDAGPAVSRRARVMQCNSYNGMVVTAEGKSGQREEKMVSVAVIL